MKYLPFRTHSSSSKFLLKCQDLFKSNEGSLRQKKNEWIVIIPSSWEKLIIIHFGDMEMREYD
jgi:hypothetical protein